MNSKNYLNFLPSIFAVVVAVVVWQITVTTLQIPIYELPAPSDILAAFYVPHMDWLANLWATSFETVAGFGLSILIGIPLAIALSFSIWFNRTVYPLIIALQVIPKVALAPIIFLILGFGVFPRVVITFMVAFFPVVIDTMTGLGSLEPDYVDLFKSLGSSKLQIFTMARLPNAMPSIFSGLKIAITLALIGAVVAEFVQANSGLGYLLLNALQFGNSPEAWAALVSLGILGGVLFMIFEGLERLTTGWYIKSRQNRL